MTYNQLKYFNAVCKYNNISKAAEKLFVSQPSVSLAIKELEEELGEALFLRNNNRLYMTEAGRMLWEMSEEMLGQMAMVTDNITKRHLESEKISIGVVPEIAGFMIPHIDEVLTELRNKYTKLDVRLMQVTQLEKDKALLNHSVDVVFCNNEGDIPARFGSKTVVRSELKCLVGEKHPLAEKECIELQDLRDTTLIGDYVNHESWGNWLRTFMKDEDFIPETRYFFLDNTSIHYLVTEKGGVTFGRPRLNSFRMDGVRAIPFKDPQYLDVVAIYDNRYVIRNVVADFMKLLKKLPDEF